MSKKPDGQGGKKERKASVFETKSVKPQKRHEAVVALHKAQGGKRMRVARGTERARRRAGLHKGWRISGAGPKMQPAKNPQPMFEATHSVTLSDETLKNLDKQKALIVKRSVQLKGLRL